MNAYMVLLKYDSVLEYSLSVQDLLGLLQACPKWPTKSPKFVAGGHFYLFFVYFSYEIYPKCLFSSLRKIKYGTIDLLKYYGVLENSLSVQDLLGLL